MVEISNKRELEEWLKDKPQEVSAVIALRCALRVQPFLTEVFETDLLKQRQYALILQSDRAMIASAVAVEYPTAKARGAAAQAANAANAANANATAVAAALVANSDPSAGPSAAARASAARAASATASDAARAAAQAANAANAAGAAAQAANAAHAAGAAAQAAQAANAAHAAAAVWQAVSQDCADVEKTLPTALLGQPIWPDGQPDWYHTQSSNAAGWLNDPEWDYWRRWYRGMRDGKPLDWEVQREIALIPDEEWDEGPERIAELIAGIEARSVKLKSDDATAQDNIALGLELTPTSETVHLDPENGALQLQYHALDNQRLYQTALEKVRDALDDLTPDGELKQHHVGLEAIIRKLRRTLDRYSENPQRVHDDFLLYARQTNGLMASGEVVDDDDVQALRDTQITGADDIRAADANVRVSVEARLKLRLDEGRVEDTETIAEALDVLALISMGELAESAKEDSATVRTVIIGVPDYSDEAVDTIYRSTGRLARAGKALRETYQSSGPATDSFLKGHALTEIMLKFIEAIGKLLGMF